jgi:ABC-type multidrug transport system fused ATPase/permease subunit
MDFFQYSSEMPALGIVGQEPVLFDCTIRENIQLGRPGATEEDVLEACREANALDFILRLPDQLNTMVSLLL